MRTSIVPMRTLERGGDNCRLDGIGERSDEGARFVSGAMATPLS